MKGLDLAAHVINRCIDLDIPIDNLKLQKMLYFLEIDFLIRFNKNLISDKFEAGQYGPFLKDVNEKYSFFGASSIKIRQEIKNDLPEKYKNEIINNIDNLAKFKTWDLVVHSHSKNTPSYKVFHDENNNKKIIPNRLMKEYAKSIEMNF